MAGIERVREVLSQPLTVEYLESKSRQGFRAVAIEWERAVDQGGPEGLLHSEVPYGLEVADDCLHLKENPSERQAMTLMLELIVNDQPLSRVAESLNQRGFKTRQGAEWTQIAVFNLLPRLTETAPEIFATQGWSDSRRQRSLMRAV